MKQDFSYTVDATSELAKQFQKAVDSAEKSIDTNRAIAIEAARNSKKSR